MNCVRRLLCFLVMGLGVALAMPSFAGPQKTYLLTVTAHPQFDVDSLTGQQTVQAPVPVTLNLTNVSQQNANSNINSFSFTVSGMTISSINKDACEAQGGTCNLANNVVTVTNISQPVQAHGVYTIQLNVSSCGDGNWSTNAYTGSQLNGDAFRGNTAATPVRCGDVDCNESFVVPDSTNSPPGSPTYVSGFRGQYEKNGTVCSADGGDVVDYFVTNTLSVNSTLHFEWPTPTTEAFHYTLTFPVASTPQVSWLGDVLGPVFIAGQPCTPTNAPNNMPAPLGVLAQSASKTDTKLKVDTSAYAALNPVPAGQFSIIIGTERLLVTNVANGNWTVMRHQGGTNPDAYLAGRTVASTPLPLILSSSFSTDQTTLQRQLAAGYVAGKQAQQCIAAPASTSWPASTFDVIDIGDGYVKGLL
jgi:hypothetical protein